MPISLQTCLPALIANHQILQVATNAIMNIDSERSVEVKDALDAWAEFRFQRQNYSSASLYTEGDGYWTLVEIGPGIIAPYDA